MAHNLSYDEKSGQYAMFSLKEIPWHGLGQIVEEAKTSKEVLELAHLNYPIEKVPNFIKVGEEFKQNGSFSVIRTDTNAVLGNILLGGYKVLQNQEIFDFMDSLVIEENDITYHTAGALGEGETVFVTAKLPGYLRIEGTDDIINKYLLMTTSHNGSTPVTIQFTNIRVVCNNTLTAALRHTDSRIIVRHTGNMASKLEEGRKLLKLEVEFSKNLEVVLSTMNKIMITSKQMQSVLNNLFMTPEQRILSESGGLSARKAASMDLLKQSIEMAPGQDLHRGTGLWLYNGITSHFQNIKSYKSSERKMQGIMMGGEEQLVSHRAMKEILELA